MIRTCVFLAVTFGFLAAVGCRPPSGQVGPAESPALPVSKPVQRDVTDYADFTGRAAAVEAVDVRPRVTGYLVKHPFKEGMEVKKGELLFEIDPRPYQAQLHQAEGQVALAKAQHKLAQTTYERDRRLVSSGAVSQQQVDQDVAAVNEAAARIKAAEASLDIYKLNLEFTKVLSPINGMVSRYYLTVGNLANQDQTLLTTVVSLHPMYVYFDMDEPTLLRLRNARNSGELKPTPRGQYPVLMALQGETGFTHKGNISFVNNQVNPATGSITLRGTFANPQPKGGLRLLSPGMFVRVRLPISQPRQALLVLDRAIGSDQGQKFVYVVDAQRKIQYRRVTTGALQPDGLRVVAQGLKPDDLVLVGGIQQVRPHMEIQPEPQPMPTLGNALPVGLGDGKQKKK
jgi:multidrug efflux system membrane fusion protein